MEALIALGVATVALVIFDVLALSRGTDSRPGFSTGSGRMPDRTLPL